MIEHDSSKPLHSSSLGIDELSACIGLAVGTIKQLRSRNPAKLPTPYLTRPLKWRAEVVESWMRNREAEEERRIKSLFEPVPRPRAQQARKGA